MSNSKVKIVAVARDEAPFLPHWVWHHIFFGFNAIDIYINRTCGNSIEILEFLKKFFPKLAYYTMDWHDSISLEYNSHVPLQLAAYSMAYENERENDYIIFLDIDEFWLPRDIYIHQFKMLSPNLIIQIVFLSAGFYYMAKPNTLSAHFGAPISTAS